MRTRTSNRGQLARDICAWGETYFLPLGSDDDTGAGAAAVTVADQFGGQTQRPVAA
jgi:hypothetical protein